MKMNTEERRSAKKDFKTPHFIFTIGFLVVGLFLAQFGNALTINVIKNLGIVLLTIGGIVSTVDLWNKNKVSRMLIPTLVVAAIFFLIK